MNMPRYKTIVYVTVTLVLSLVLAAGADAQPKQEKLSFSIVTGGTGGVWYPLGGAIAGVIGKYVPNTEATAEATTAAIDNMKLLAAGKAGLAFAYDYHVGWANDGKVPGISGKHKIRLVMGFYEQPLHIVTTSGTGITTVMQLKGKRVSVGAPNSGTEEQADYVLKALGIDWNKDIKKEKLGAGESVAALKDGKIDAFFWSGAVPTSSIIDMASTPGTKMVLLPVGGETAEQDHEGESRRIPQVGLCQRLLRRCRERHRCARHHGRSPGDGHLPGGTDLPDPEGDLRQQDRAFRCLERGHGADTGKGSRAGNVGGAQVCASRRAEILQGEGRTEVSRTRAIPVGKSSARWAEAYASGSDRISSLIPAGTAGHKGNFPGRTCRVFLAIRTSLFRAFGGKRNMRSTLHRSLSLGCFPRRPARVADYPVGLHED